MKDYILDLDKPRELRFGFKALRMIREKFGDRNIDQLLSVKVDEIPSLILPGLKWEDSSLDLNKVEDLLDDAIPKKYTILGLTTIVLEALAAQMGVDVKSKEEDKGDSKKDSAGGTKKEAEKKKEVTKLIPSTKTQKK